MKKTIIKKRSSQSSIEVIQRTHFVYNIHIYTHTRTHAHTHTHTHTHTNTHTHIRATHYTKQSKAKFLVAAKQSHNLAKYWSAWVLLRC